MEAPAKKPNPIRLSIAIVMAFVISFALPAILPGGQWRDRTSGFEVLVDMWNAGMEVSAMALVGLGFNLLFCLGVFCLLCKLWLPAIGLGILPLVGAVYLVPLGMDGEPPPAEKLILGPGYYLWVSSMVLLVLVGILRKR
jgi:hypothetical protein